MFATLAALGLFSQGATEPTADELADLVRTVRENYACYEEARTGYVSGEWERLEGAATREPTLAAIHAYVQAFEDPAPGGTTPPLPAQGGPISRRLHIRSGPHLYREAPDGSFYIYEENPPYHPRIQTPTFNVDNAEDMKLLGSVPATRSAILDLRGGGKIAAPADAVLALVTDKPQFVEPGLEVFVTEKTLAAWRADPGGLPGGEASLARMAAAPLNSFVALTQDRPLALARATAPLRIAILVSPNTTPESARFVELARQSPRVRVFGSRTRPFGERGVRQLPFAGGRWIGVPTIRRRGPMRVIPDEETESIPAELRSYPVDFARYRADQWCQHGE